MSERRIRELIEESRPAVGSVGWPQEVRERAGKYAKARRESGESWKSISSSLGLGTTTIREWVKGLSIEERGRASMVPVVVTGGGEASAGRSRSLVLVSPAGYRLEGLDLWEGIEALERLG